MIRKLTPFDLALWAALPMAHTSRIEGRLKMILDTQTRRTLPRRAGIVSLALAGVLVLPLAAVHPVPAKSAPAKIAGTPPIKREALPPAAAWTLMTAKDRVTERRLKQAEAADPTSPKWPEQLGFLYFLHVADDATPASRAWARASLTQYDRAALLAQQWMVRNRHVPPYSGPLVSEKIAKMAFAAGDHDRARRCAVALLQSGQSQEQSGEDQSEDVHTANLVLGRLALRDGSTAQAEKHLLAMGRISGSPALGSFGPNMRLAKELLVLGKRDTVLAYFDECAKFWTYDNGKTLKTWKAQVRQGKMPNFGGNLYY